MNLIQIHYYDNENWQDPDNLCSFDELSFLGGENNDTILFQSK